MAYAQIETALDDAEKITLDAYQRVRNAEIVGKQPDPIKRLIEIDREMQEIGE